MLLQPAGRTSQLRLAYQLAFQMRQEREAFRTRPSKRTPLGDPRTGPEAAILYCALHPRGGLRQAQRALNIAAGQRPLKFDVPGKRERAIAAKLKRAAR